MTYMRKTGVDKYGKSDHDNCHPNWHKTDWYWVRL